jgi:nucleotide-binding universal stress UspA family protein
VLKQHPSLKLETRSEFGFTSDTIEEIARDGHFDYIVMGTKGAGNIIDEVLGSNTVSVFDKAPCPVWAIPSHSKNNNIKNVVYASDYDGNDKKTINETLDFAAIFNAEVHVIHIMEENEPNVFSVDEYTNSLRKEYSEKPISFRNMHRKDLESGVVHYAENQHADVIVVARQERGFLESLFHKSASKQFLLHSNIPILALKKN